MKKAAFTVFTLGNSCYRKRVKEGLSVWPLQNPLSLRNSEELVELLELFHRKDCRVASLDIKDFYYSLDQGVLLQRVRDWL